MRFLKRKIVQRQLFLTIVWKGGPGGPCDLGDPGGPGDTGGPVGPVVPGNSGVPGGQCGQDDQPR